MQLSKETIKAEKPLLNTFQFLCIRGKLKVTLRTRQGNLMYSYNEKICKGHDHEDKVQNQETFPGVQQCQYVL